MSGKTLIAVWAEAPARAILVWSPAGWSIEPFAQQLEKQGLGRRLVEDHVFGTELGLIAFNQDFVAQNEDLVVRFMAGYLKAARLLDNGGWQDDKVVSVVSKYTGTESDTLRGIPYTIRSEDGAIDMASVREQEEFFRARGDYPVAYRWECDIGLLLGALRLRDMATWRFAVADLRAHYDVRGFFAAAWQAVRLRMPSRDGNAPHA